MDIRWRGPRKNIIYFDTIEQQTSLKSIVFQNVALESGSLMLQPLGDLEKFTAFNTNFNVLYFNNPELKSIEIVTAPLASFELNNMTSLDSLTITHTALNSINLEEAPNLTNVFLEQNEFSELTINYLNAIDWIENIQF